MNTFGKTYRLTTWGESHGEAIGGVIDGCPSGITISLEQVKKDMQSRRPGQSDVSSPRSETDDFEILSGLNNGITNGQPIAFTIKNKNKKSTDYDALQNIYRPSHADYTYEVKYGMHDRSGGGRSSARETANWVFAGSIAQQILAQQHINLLAFVKKIGTITLPKNFDEIDRNYIEKSIVRCPDETISNEMIAYILQLKSDGNTCGGVIQCAIEGIPAGLGEPIFDKLNARLAQAMMTINAVRAFELGDGIEMSSKTGGEVNDSFIYAHDEVKTVTNHSAGIQGGISNGMPIWFNVYFKPVSSIKSKQFTINTEHESVELHIEGRHDPCVVPRAVAIVKAMTAMVCLDFVLINQQNKIK
ncbi:MAG: chorismate synthase [Bacteroidetes bacterium]|nr:chorismate synthase [Bacteroidota bacterium]